MRKNKIYMIFLVFVMFFCVNTGDVLARQDKDGGGGVAYSYGIKCFYKGNLKGNSTYGGSTGTTISGGETTTPFVYGIDYYCNGGTMSSDGLRVSNCKQFGAWGHGLVAHINGSENKGVSIGNYNEIFNKNNMPDSTYNYFGAEKDKGVLKCPSKIYVNGDLTANASQLMGSGEYSLGNMSWTSGKNSLSLLSNKTIRYKKGEGGDLKADVKKIVSEYKEVTCGGGKCYDTTRGSVGDEINSTQNKEAVDSINKASDNWSGDDDSSNGNVSCAELLGNENVELISNILFGISIAGVVLVIVLGSTDFVKAVASSDDDALAKAWKKFRYRIISVVILLLLPVLVDFILSFVNDNLRFKRIDINGNPNGEVTIEVGKASDCN